MTVTIGNSYRIWRRVPRKQSKTRRIMSTVQILARHPLTGWVAYDLNTKKLVHVRAASRLIEAVQPLWRQAA